MESMSAELLAMMFPAELIDRMTARTLFASTENGFVTVPVASRLLRCSYRGRVDREPLSS
jgi:hypothetical protein